MNPKSKLLQRRAECSTSSWTCILQFVCDVILAVIVERCPHLRPLYFCLLWSVWCSCEYVYVWKLSCTLTWDWTVTLKLEYRESWVATLQLLVLLCKASLTKLFEIHHWSWISGVHFSISAGSGNFVFWPSQQRVRQLSSVQRTLHLEVKYAIKWYTSTK